MLSEQTFTTDELTISYVEGPASGPPMVLLHGLTLRRQNYQALIPRFTADWHIYACDLRGHGKSGRVADRYLLADYIPDTVAFLRSRVTEPAVIVGHSLGGLIAPGVAAAAPELVRALILLDPAACLRTINFADAPANYEWFYWAYETIRSPRSQAEMLELCRARAGGGSAADLQGFVDMMSGIAPQAVQVALEDRLFEGYDLESVLRQVQVPTLVLHGALPDCTMLAEDVELAQRTLSQGVIVSVLNAGHMIHAEQTDFVVEQMQAFLDTI